MYVIKDGKITMVENNPDWCNNRGEECGGEGYYDIPENCTGCEYYFTETTKAENTYTTFDAKKFLDKMGSHSIAGKMNSSRGLWLMEREAIKKRTRWGTINEKKYVKHLDNLIEGRV